jgi:hypothetical protein
MSQDEVYKMSIGDMVLVKDTNDITNLDKRRLGTLRKLDSWTHTIGVLFPGDNYEEFPPRLIDKFIRK